MWKMGTFNDPPIQSSWPPAFRRSKDCLVDDGSYGEGDEGDDDGGQEDAAARRVRIYSRPSSLDVSFSGVFLK